MAFKTVHVVSWVNYSGGEATGGGFDWYSTRKAADAAYQRLEQHYRESGWGVVLRRVDVKVPPDLDGDDLTALLDRDLDDLEVNLPALREYRHNTEED